MPGAGLRLFDPIAAQEMLHLAQAWNLFPEPSAAPRTITGQISSRFKYYPLQLPLEAAGSALERWTDSYNSSALPISRLPVTKDADGPDFHSVGQLYGLIASGFKNIPEEVLFVGFEDRQVGTDLVDFPDLVKVTNRKFALTAIELVTHQGEGIRPTEKTVISASSARFAVRISSKWQRRKRTARFLIPCARASPTRLLRTIPPSRDFART